MSQTKDMDSASANASADTVVESEKVVESNIEPKQAQPEPPPNGGWFAWLQVAGSFFLFFNCWGTVNTFGAFQTYYEDIPYWKEDPSNISWIGSIQAFLLLMIGVVTGPIYDRGYFRSLIVTGGFLITFGFMMTSLCREYWQVILAQGIVIGLGNGCLWIPSVATIPQYFSTKKALATGIAAAGSSIGGIVHPITFRHLELRYLEQHIGFGWAVRVLGFIALGTMAFSIAVMKQRVMPKMKRDLLDFSGFKDVPYTLFCVGAFLAFAGICGPVYYMQPYAIQKGITDVSFAFYLIPIYNAVSVPGRILPNFLADHIGAINVIIPAIFLTGMMALVWISVTTFSGIITFACFYGVFSGAYVAIAPVTIVVLTPDLRKIGTRMGHCFFVCSFGLLMGTPVSGAILSATGSYLGVQLFSGLLLIATGCVFLTARIIKVGAKIKVKI